MRGQIDILPLMEAECQGARKSGPYARQTDNRAIDLFPNGH